MSSNMLQKWVPIPPFAHVERAVGSFALYAPYGATETTNALVARLYATFGPKEVTAIAVLYGAEDARRMVFDAATRTALVCFSSRNPPKNAAGRTPHLNPIEVDATMARIHVVEARENQFTDALATRISAWGGHVKSVAYVVPPNVCSNPRKLKTLMVYVECGRLAENVRRRIRDELPKCEIWPSDDAGFEDQAGGSWD